MQKSSENKKTLSYSKGNCNLNVTFNTEIKSEMQDLVEILKTAADDVQKNIDALKS